MNIVTCEKEILNENYFLNSISSINKNYTQTLQVSRVIPIQLYHKRVERPPTSILLGRLMGIGNVLFVDEHRKGIRSTVRVRKISCGNAEAVREPPVFARGRDKGVGTALFPSAKSGGSTINFSKRIHERTSRRRRRRDETSKHLVSPHNPPQPGNKWCAGSRRYGV